MGFLECRYCSVTYRAPLNNLTEPTDIYHGWIDSCEDLERSNTAAKSAKEARISLERPSADSSGLENYREEEISRGSVRREEKSF